jgi:outer membrane protein OmpA-like peptidoglycan-associated protein
MGRLVLEDQEGNQTRRVGSELLMISIHQIRLAAAALIGGSVLVFTGCAPLLLGAAVTGGVAVSYTQGVVVETYDSDYHRVVSASRETLESLKIPVTETLGDELKTAITARRPDQTPVSIEVVRLAAGRTRAGVRTGHIGVTELDTSAHIHEQIRLRLARTAAPETPAAAASVRPRRDDKSGDTPATPEPEKARAKAPARNETARSARVIINFDPGSNELLESERLKVESIVAVLTARPKTKVTIYGYANVNDPPGDNRAVSESCAGMVKTYMIDKGVDAGRIRTIGQSGKGILAAETGADRHVEIAFDAPQ